MALNRTNILLSIFIAAIACFSASCSNTDREVPTGSGTVILSCITSNTYIDQAGSTIVASDPATADFSLTVTSVGGGYSHEWNSLDELPLELQLSCGEYQVFVVVGELNDTQSPTYTALANFSVLEKSHTKLNLNAKLCESVNKVVLGEGLLQAYPNAKVALHSEGSPYVDVTGEPVYLPAGDQQLYLTLEDGVTIISDKSLATEEGHGYIWHVDLSDQTLTMGCGDTVSEIGLTEELLQAQAPTIQPKGFNPDEPLLLVEGEDPPGDVGFDVTSPSPISRLVLTVQKPMDDISDIAPETNLLSDVPEGVIVEREGNNYSVRFDDYLENIRCESVSEFNFSLMAVDVLGRCAQPLTLHVTALPVSFRIAHIEPALIGTNRPVITIYSTESLNPAGISVLYEFNAQWTKAEDIVVEDVTDSYDVKAANETSFYQDTDSDSNSEGSPTPNSLKGAVQKIYNITFPVPLGADNLPVKVFYFSRETAQSVIPRDCPKYNVSANAFTSTVVLTVSTEDEDSVAASQITSLLKVYIDKKEAVVFNRMPEKHILAVSGLNAKTRYTISTAVFDPTNPNRFSRPVTFTTEEAVEVPIGDFEDKNRSFKFEDFPSGGRYSLSNVPLFTYQNFTNVDVYEPHFYWATTNAKTFNINSKHHNTWFMQPSAQIVEDDVQEGLRAMCLTSVGWDMDGEPIPDYLQDPSGEVIHYNANIPKVAHRSAGKLFLGTYSFNPVSMTETYNEGYSFSSRPVALNGYYKYLTGNDDPDDQGYVEIELVAADGTTIAHTVEYLDVSIAYRAFSIQFDYFVADKRPSKLKIMFASTKNIGTIEEEDQMVRVSPIAPEAVYHGSTLWVDNLYFSY